MLTNEVLMKVLNFRLLMVEGKNELVNVSVRQSCDDNYGEDNDL